jgi:hypothetical protein
MPSEKQLDIYYDKILSTFPEHFQNIERKYSVSYAEALDYTNTTMKRQIIAALDAK